MRLFTPLLAGLAGLLVLAGCSDGKVDNTAPTGAVGPAIWKTSDDDTTIYLFGTMHLLPPDVQWRTPQMNAAFDASKAIYFETDINPDRSVLDPLVAEFGLYRPDDKLSEHLTAEQMQAVADAADKLKIDMARLELLRPWLAANVIADQMIVNAGYDPNSGAERTLEPMAKAANKNIRKLETVQSQIMVWPSLSEADQVAFLVEGVKHLDEATETLPKLAHAWAAGDVATLEKLMLDQDLADTPAVYDALIVKRNTDWTRQIEALTDKESGTFFIAVGAAHLIGKDGLPKMLAAKGSKVERVQ